MGAGRKPRQSPGLTPVWRGRGQSPGWPGVGGVRRGDWSYKSGDCVLSRIAEQGAGSVVAPPQRTISGSAGRSYVRGRGRGLDLVALEQLLADDHALDLGR